METEHITTKQLVSGGAQNVAGTVGRWSYFHASTDARLGGWYNAAKANLSFGATGSVTGMASAFNAELQLPNQNLTSLGGVYTAYEANLNFQANTVMADNVNYPSSFMNMALSGTQAQRDIWEDSAGGCLFALSGFNANDASVFSLNSNLTKKGALKIIIGGVPYYIMLATSPTS